MHSNNMEEMEELTKEQWLLILFSLVTDVPEKEWDEFAYDLVYKDRFSSSHKIVDVINNYAERCATTIKTGEILYRARVYHQNPLQEFFSKTIKSAMGENFTKGESCLDEYYGMQFAASMMAVEKGNLLGKKIVDAYKKWQRKRFKGYNASASGAPPANNGTAGRINPARIRYLYLAEDPQTAIYEVRPIIGQHVSVATFRVQEELNIYDMAREISSLKSESQDKDATLFSVIQQRFSEPNAGDEYRYLPTQFLGEMIKHMGFDGLRFRSSIRKGGYNIVLFDDRKCKAICSDLIQVGDIELKFNNPEIYQLEEMMKL